MIYATCFKAIKGTAKFFMDFFRNFCIRLSCGVLRALNFMHITESVFQELSRGIMSASNLEINSHLNRYTVPCKGNCSVVLMISLDLCDGMRTCNM